MLSPGLGLVGEASQPIKGRMFGQVASGSPGSLDHVNHFAGSSAQLSRSLLQRRVALALFPNAINTLDRRRVWISIKIGAVRSVVSLVGHKISFRAPLNCSATPDY
jgi:hypothetical protein